MMISNSTEGNFSLVALHGVPVLSSKHMATIINKLLNAGNGGLEMEDWKWRTGKCVAILHILMSILYNQYTACTLKTVF